MVKVVEISQAVIESEGLRIEERILIPSSVVLGSTLTRLLTLVSVVTTVLDF